MKVDTYASGFHPPKYLTVRARTPLSNLPADVTGDPEMRLLTPLLLGYDLLSSADREGFDYVRLTHRIESTGFAIHGGHAGNREAAGIDIAA